VLSTLGADIGVVCADGTDDNVSMSAAFVDVAGVGGVGSVVHLFSSSFLCRFFSR
jgi:hypothetical protein